MLLLCGVAFHLAEGFNVEFAPLRADSVGGAFFFAGLFIKAAAPLAHVWFKDGIASASPVGRRVKREPIALPAPGERAGTTV